MAKAPVQGRGTAGALLQKFAPGTRPHSSHVCPCGRADHAKQRSQLAACCRIGWLIIAPLLPVHAGMRPCGIWHSMDDSTGAVSVQLSDG